MPPYVQYIIIHTNIPMIRMTTDDDDIDDDDVVFVDSSFNLSILGSLI